MKMIYKIDETEKRMKYEYNASEQIKQWEK